MKRITADNPPGDVLLALKEQLRRMEGSRRKEDAQPIPSGCPALDRLLPGGGWIRGTLVEWLAESRGGGAGTLAMIAAREAAADGGAVVVMDRHRTFYPPAAAALGVDLENLIVIQAGSEKDQLWALDQALRCQAVAAVWAPQEKVDPHTFRRLQLAAEDSGVLGLLLRNAHVRGRPSWSDMQLLVRPQPVHRGRRVRLELIRSRSSTGGGSVNLEIDETTGALREASRGNETYPVHPPAELARATRRRRSAGA